MDDSKPPSFQNFHHKKLQKSLFQISWTKWLLHKNWVISTEKLLNHEQELVGNGLNGFVPHQQADSFSSIVNLSDCKKVQQGKTSWFIDSRYLCSLIVFLFLTLCCPHWFGRWSQIFYPELEELTWTPSGDMFWINYFYMISFQWWFI